MLEFGNLANVCGRRKGVLMQVLNGNVLVSLPHCPNLKPLMARWDDNAQVNQLIFELNFGTYAESEEKQ